MIFLQIGILQHYFLWHLCAPQKKKVYRSFGIYLYSCLKNSCPRMLAPGSFRARTIVLTSPPAQNALSPDPFRIMALFEFIHLFNVGWIFWTIDRFSAFRALGRFKTMNPFSPTCNANLNKIFFEILLLRITWQWFHVITSSNNTSSCCSLGLGACADIERTGNLGNAFPLRKPELWLIIFIWDKKQHKCYKLDYEFWDRNFLFFYHFG